MFDDHNGCSDSMIRNMMSQLPFLSVVEKFDINISIGKSVARDRLFSNKKPP